MIKRSFPVPGQGAKKNGVAMAEKSKKSSEVTDEQLEAMVGGMSKKTAPPKNPTKPIAQEDMDEEEEWDDDLDEDEDFSDEDEDDDEETLSVSADEEEEEEEEEPAPPPRKGPGRPPKSEAVVKPAADQKRGPGRPKKVQDEKENQPVAAKPAKPQVTSPPASDALKLLTEQVTSLTNEVAQLKKAAKAPSSGNFSLGAFFQALADHFNEK